MADVRGEIALVAVGALSTMICVKPRPDEAAAIADPDGDDPSTLHVTLCYLGDVDGDLGHVVEALGPVGATHAPLAGTVAGVGMFTATPSSDGLVPAILLPDVPGLVELRVAVTEALQRAGIDYSRVHGYLSHITLEYLDPAAEGEPVERSPFRDDQAGAPLHFDEILVVRSDVEVVPVPLTGATPLTAALTAAGEGFCLPRELRLRTDPVRQAFLRTVMTPPLEAAGLSFDVTNPLAAHVLAQAGSHVTSISETTQADLMKVIAASHEQGLSIPDTARAIQAHMDEAAATRATTIARTELAAAANGGSLAATRTVAEATGDTYLKRWMTAPGARYPRHELYDGLDGQTVALDDYFDVGGDQLQFPGDPSGDPGEVINCFPGGTLVAAYYDARVGFRRRYRGGLVRIETDGDHRLAGTPNHPVLTSTGWKPLALLREGDYLVCGTLREGEAALGSDPDVDHAPAAIQQVVGALAREGLTRRVRGRAVQFHGDGSDGDVEVVATGRRLRLRGEAALAQPLLEPSFVGADEVERPAPTARPSREIRFGSGRPADRFVRRLREPNSLLGARLPHALVHRSGSVATLDAELEQPPTDHATADAVALGESLLGNSFDVSLAKVVQVEEYAFHGDVFNLETEKGAYIAGGIISHNCRCTMSYSGDPSDAEGMANMDAAAPPHPVHAHNAVIKRAYERVDELEPRLAAVLEPILRRAGEVAAANFEAYATDHLTAAGEWTPPSAEEILPIACDHPGAIQTAAQPSAARAAATAILHDAARAEPDVTSALQAISRRAGGEMAGLDFRVKSEASLARKIESKMLANPGVTPDQVAGRINDALRYTMNFQPDRYGAGVQAAISDLERAGFKPLEVENYWGPQSPEYKGINAVFEAPHGQRFELQFHTPQSFALKNGANHQLYESFRTTTAAPDRVHLWDQMTENASRLDVPAGAGDVGLPVGHAAPVAEAAPFRADIGVTPFRSATDEAVGFYDSPKFAQFLGDVHESADAYGVQVDGIDRVTGIWQGETEPSVSLRAHDGEAGVRAFAANLGQAYNQDGVLIFSDAHAGDVMATFEKSVTQSEATDLMRKVGIDGGRFTEDGKLQIIGSGPEFVQQLDELAAEMGSRYQAAVGRFELLDRDAGQYREALRQFAGATA